jgi:hypothetical protein
VPDAVTGDEYGTPTVAVAVTVDVMAGRSLTTTVDSCEVAPATFVAVMVKVNDPVSVGKPERTPVPGLNAIPVGSVPVCVRVIGVGPVVVTVVVYGVPRVAAVGTVEVMVGFARGVKMENLLLE